MGARVEQSGEFLPRAGRARRRHLEDMADSLHRLPSAAEDLYVIVPRRNRALLLQGEFCITLTDSDYTKIGDPSLGLDRALATLRDQPCLQAVEKYPPLVISSPLWRVSDVALLAFELPCGRVILRGVHDAPEVVSPA